MSEQPETMAPEAARAETSAHWTIFLPALAVAVTWGIVYFWSGWTEPPLLVVARIALVIEGVVVPLLLLHAFMRARALRVRVGEGALKAVSGFPMRRRLELSLGDIAVAQVRRPATQRWFGGGALAIITRQGARHLIADLAEPEKVAAAINNAIRRNSGA
jgi:membrane protein YdbS with pleckstrin-like domain